MKTITNYVLAILFCSLGEHSSAQVVLYPSDGIKDGQFGLYVEIAGQTAVIGAFGSETNGVYNGAAYVFDLNNDGWVEHSKLLPNVPLGENAYGQIVAFDGETIVVSAFQENETGPRSGVAYIFEKNGLEWIQTAKLTPEPGASYGAFGFSADIHGDYLVIGAYIDNQVALFGGAAYVFKRENGTWTQVNKLVPFDGGPQERFGRSVAISEDYAAICSVFDGDQGLESGSVYMYKRFGNTFEYHSKLIPSDVVTYDRFGRSLALSGDYLAVSSVMDDENGDNSGSAYVYHLENNLWKQEAKLIPSDGGAGDLSGYSLDIEGSRVILSAHLHDALFPDAGAAYLFEKEGNQWIEKIKLEPTDGSDCDKFGICVDLSDEYVIVGAPFYKNEQLGGAAFVYRLDELLSLVEIKQEYPVTVFPNPSKGSFNLSFSPKHHLQQVEIYDANGILLFTQSNPTELLNLTGLSSGHYYVKLSFENWSITERIIIDD